MTHTPVRRLTVTALVLAMAAGTFAQTTLVVPVDPTLATQISAAVRTAEDDGNYAAALREDRRWLELYPNEPVLQAAIYQTMSATAEKSGDAKSAAEFASIAKSLDPTLAARIAGGQTTTTTRGDKGDKFIAAMSVAMATMSAVQQARQQSKDAKAQSQMQAQMQAQQMQQPPPMQQQMQQQAMAPQQPMQPMQGQPMQQAYAYPAAPMGAPGYQPAPQPMPMPGYAPQGYPQAQGQQAGSMPAPGQPAGYMPPPGSPAQAPPQGYAPQGYPPQGQPPAGYAPPGYYAPADPNAAPAGYAPAGGVRRGDALKPMRVVHDHSLAGAPAYFATGCGALLSVDGTNLVFTPGGGEKPRVIAAADIREMRMNTTIGKEVGAFHIATKQGLYLHLAPESGKSEDARAIIDALTKALGL